MKRLFGVRDAFERPVTLWVTLAVAAILGGMGRPSDGTRLELWQRIRCWCLLDRFDSFLLAAPAFFHYVGYACAHGIGLEEAKRIFSLGVAG